MKYPNSMMVEPMWARHLKANAVIQNSHTQSSKVKTKAPSKKEVNPMPHNIVSKMDVLDPRPNEVVGSRKALLIVDYSNWLYRAYFSSLKDLEIRPWMPFIRALDMLRTCVKHIKGHESGVEVEFLFCGDTVRRKLDRMKTDEMYKEERPSTTNLGFYIFRNLMSFVIKDIGCNIVYHEGSEGDDVIASLVHKFAKKCDCSKPCANCKCAEKDPYASIVIFSCDRDLNSLLCYRGVSIYRPPSIFYTRNDFLEEFGFAPDMFEIYRALVGDKSDGVKGVTAWGDSRAKTHINKMDWEEALKKEDKMDQFEHSLALVSLRKDIPDLPAGGCHIKVGSDGEVFEKLKAEYYRQDAIDDVIFAERRLEEACKSYTIGGKVNEDESGDKDKTGSVEEGLPF